MFIIVTDQSLFAVDLNVNKLNVTLVWQRHTGDWQECTAGAPLLKQNLLGCFVRRDFLAPLCSCTNPALSFIYPLGLCSHPGKSKFIFDYESSRCALSLNIQYLLVTHVPPPPALFSRFHILKKGDLITYYFILAVQLVELENVV